MRTCQLPFTISASVDHYSMQSVAHSSDQARQNWAEDENRVGLAAAACVPERSRHLGRAFLRGEDQKTRMRAQITFDGDPELRLERQRRLKALIWLHRGCIVDIVKGRQKIGGTGSQRGELVWRASVWMDCRWPRQGQRHVLDSTVGRSLLATVIGHHISASQHHTTHTERDFFDKEGTQVHHRRFDTSDTDRFTTAAALTAFADSDGCCTSLTEKHLLLTLLPRPPCDVSPLTGAQGRQARRQHLGW